MSSSHVTPSIFNFFLGDLSGGLVIHFPFHVECFTGTVQVISDVPQSPSKCTEIEEASLIWPLLRMQKTTKPDESHLAVLSIYDNSRSFWVWNHSSSFRISPQR